MITLEDLQGHWRRDWLALPGHFDPTTRVHWLQSGSFYADIRIPKNRPPLEEARCLADLPAQALAGLMTAEGFAGTISVANSFCTWDRHINWHGQPDVADTGDMSFENGALIEKGVHAEYSERWLPELGGTHHAENFTVDQRWGIVVTVGQRFLFAIGEEGAPSSRTLRDALGSGDIAGGVEAHFDSTYALGRWTGTVGKAELCTNPFTEGHAILTRKAPGELVWHSVDFHGTQRDVRLSTD